MNYQIDLNDSNLPEDQKDALDAFNSFSKARNLFFWFFLLIPLLLVQVAFWSVDCGGIDRILLPSAQNTISEEEALPAGPSDAESITVEPTDESPAQIEDKMEDNEDSDSLEWLDIAVRTILMAGKFILAFAVVIYCLTLLIGMKLAIVGRLGGLAYSSKAFFLSLVVMVLILPWQHTVAADIYGALFDYQELTARYLQIQNCNHWPDYVLYYGRFVGIWSLSVILLLLAQRNSCRAIKMISQHLVSRENNVLNSDNDLQQE